MSTSNLNKSDALLKANINSKLDGKVKKDWSKSLFYSSTLHSLKFFYPPDQLGLYFYSALSIGIIGKAYWKAWNIKQAERILNHGGDSDMLPIHRYFTKMTNYQLKSEAGAMIKILKFNAFALAGIIMTGFTAFVQLKNKHRAN